MLSLSLFSLDRPAPSQRLLILNTVIYPLLLIFPPPSPSSSVNYTPCDVDDKGAGVQDLDCLDEAYHIHLLGIYPLHVIDRDSRGNGSASDNCLADKADRDGTADLGPDNGTDWTLLLLPLFLLFLLLLLLLLLIIIHAFADEGTSSRTGRWR